MALLNPITAPWECGLVLPSGLRGAAASSWGPLSFCPHRQCPEGQVPLQCPEAPSIPRDAWRLRGGGVHAVISNRRGASSCAWGHLLNATYIHLWVHSSMPPACQCTDTHAAGIWDSTCVCLLLSHQGQPSQGHSPHLWLL